MLTSTQNEKVKNIIKLRKARERKARGLTVVEGRHEISLALSSGVELIELYRCKNFTSDRNFKVKINENKFTEVDEKVFRKISLRENPDGWLSLCKTQEKNLDEIKLSSTPLILVLDNIEKPGNIGAILRTADAVGADAVILTNSQTEIYNPNVIRASLGTVFSVLIVASSIKNVTEYFYKNKIKTYGTTPGATSNYTELDYKEGTAIIVGSEHEGLSKEWLRKVDEKIRIPMKGTIDSLNASVSTAVVLYEIIRQRE